MGVKRPPRPPENRFKDPYPGDGTGNLHRLNAGGAASQLCIMSPRRK